MSDPRYLPVKQIRDEAVPVVSSDEPIKQKAYKMISLSNEGQTQKTVQGKYLPQKTIFKQG